MNYLVLATALTLPLSATSMAFAAGGGEEKAPTKIKCEEAQVYDKKTKTCIASKDSSLSDDDRYQSVRQLAYGGRYDDAQVVLAAMAQDDDRTLTYLGFTHRKQGDVSKAMMYYTRALEVNPSNLLARSYMGQGLVEAGDMKGAIAQLRAIRTHGGSDTWAEASLRTAIATGQTFNY